MNEGYNGGGNVTATSHETPALTNVGSLVAGHVRLVYRDVTKHFDILVELPERI